MGRAQGHEYTLDNARFAMWVEPWKSEVSQRLTHAYEMRLRRHPTVPSTMESERRVNPFFRCGESEFAATVATRLKKADDKMTPWWWKCCRRDRGIGLPRQTTSSMHPAEVADSLQRLSGIYASVASERGDPPLPRHNHAETPMRSQPAATARTRAR